MDIVFVVLFVITLFMLSGYSRFKKLVAEQGDATTMGRSVPHEMPPAPEVEYFTYEKETPQSYAYTRPQAYKVKNEEETPVEQPSADMVSRFDLRQAVISQVILNNKYIGEINQ
ncbi:MAG: hypothetical protein J6I49_00455 [Bacteroidales bacterium]|nr:hypothetical protein [Bacteroidales bacterium]